MAEDSLLSLEGLDSDQARAVGSDAMPLCVLAGAGSGKSRVLVRRVERRILDGSADAQHVMVLTFTRKAAGELRERLKRIGVDGVTAGTFHSIAFAELRQRYLDAGKTPPAIASAPQRLVQTALENMRVDRSVDVRRVMPEISWARSHRLDSKTYASEVMRTKRRTPIAPPLFGRLLDAYEAEKRKRHVLDYDDLLASLTHVLETNAGFAKTQRWKFRHFFVDEFQDLNRAQFDLLRAWLGDRNDLFVVGDANQAIYEWNGADASFLRKIHFHFPGIEIVELGTNYRSTRQILDAAAAVLPEGKAVRPMGDMGGTLTAFDGPVPTVDRYLDERNEAVSIARKVRKHHASGRRWCDISVLVRTNAQRRSLEAAFQQFGIPFSSGAGTGWASSVALKPAMTLFGEHRSGELAGVAPDVDDMAAETQEQDRALFERLRAAINEFLANDRTVKVADFLTWLELSSRNDGPDASESVVVTTFHRAKGLEWPVVFLAGLDSAFVPYGGLKTDRVQEEQRLFYVAVTRAREQLHLSWAMERSGPGGSVIECNISPWLEQIQTLFDGAAQESLDRPDFESTLPKQERFDASQNSARVNLLDWRSKRARLMGVSPSAVMTDDVVDLLSAECPTSIERISEITGFGPLRAVSMGPELLDALKNNE